MSKILPTLFFLCLLATASLAAPGWPFDLAWSYANANVVHDEVARLYYPHASALLTADSAFQNGKSVKQLILSLRTLPGVNAVIVSSVDSSRNAQFPATFLALNAFSRDLLKLPQATRRSVSPILHTIVGGKTNFLHLPFGDSTLSLLTRYIHPDSLQPPTAAITLVLDRDWLIKELPNRLDSLVRENTQLLYFAPSPQNHDAVQSMGLLMGTDTLWWHGPKNVNAPIRQGLWPFPTIEINSFVHWIGPDFERHADTTRTQTKSPKLKPNK